jgi:hypothetical protein
MALEAQTRARTLNRERVEGTGVNMSPSLFSMVAPHIMHHGQRGKHCKHGPPAT